MGLQQFERRLERLVEGVFARAFRSGLQPVEVGRRLTREMDLHRTVAPRGTLVPNQFTVYLSPEDHERFAPIEEELVAELVSTAQDHARDHRYIFLGSVKVALEADEDLAPGTLAVVTEIAKSAGPTSALVLPDGRRLPLGTRPFRVGRLPDCDLVLADPNVSRRHAELRPNGDGGWVVADLASTNGSQVNGIPISAPQALRSGDEITVGGTHLRFETQP
jgi:hypothetical protein